MKFGPEFLTQLFSIAKVLCEWLHTVSIRVNITKLTKTGHCWISNVKANQLIVLTSILWKPRKKSRVKNPENPGNQDLFLSSHWYSRAFDPQDSGFFIFRISRGFLFLTPGSGCLSWDGISRQKVTTAQNYRYIFKYFFYFFWFMNKVKFEILLSWPHLVHIFESTKWKLGDSCRYQSRLGSY